MEGIRCGNKEYRSPRRLDVSAGFRSPLSPSANRRPVPEIQCRLRRNERGRLSLLAAVRRSIRPTRASLLSLGRAILYVPAGSSSNLSLSVKPGVILMPSRAAPRPPQSTSITSQVKRVRFSSGPPWRLGDSIPLYLERIGNVPIERAATSGSREAGRTARRARRPQFAYSSAHNRLQELIPRTAGNHDRHVSTEDGLCTLTESEAALWSKLKSCSAVEMF